MTLQTFISERNFDNKDFIREKLKFLYEVKAVITNNINGGNFEPRYWEVDIVNMVMSIAKKSGLKHMTVEIDNDKLFEWRRKQVKKTVESLRNNH